MIFFSLLFEPSLFDEECTKIFFSCPSPIDLPSTLTEARRRCA
jgi:hypothetical protein